MSIETDKRKPALKTHDEMVSAWMNDRAFKAEYNALEEEYQLLREMLHARKRAGLTQEDVAERMGTTAPAIARLEASGARDKHSPSVSTLPKYAHAVGCTLEIHLKPVSKKGLKEQYASSE
jgi:DNA-binding XRE family transcriptional regulator